LVALALGLTFAVSAATSPHLSIRQASNYALSRNPQILQFQERIAQRAWDERSALGGFLPSVTLSGSFNQMDEPLTIDLDPVREAMIKMQTLDQINFASISSQIKGGPAINDPASPIYQTVYSAAYSAYDQAVPHFVDTLKKQQYPAAAITAVQPLFAGGCLVAAKRAAQADRRAAEWELQRTRNELLQETVDNYLAVALTEAVVAVRQDVLKAMEQHRHDAEKLAAQGVIAKYHLLRAEVAVADAERNLFDDRNRCELAQLALRKTLNLDEQIDLGSVDTLQYRSVDDSLTMCLAESQEKQPVLKLLDCKQAMAQQKVRAQTGTLMPQIAAFGRVELLQDYLSALEPNWVVGINARMALFAGGRNVAGVAAARHQVKEVEAVRSSLRQDIALWINKSYRDMRCAEQRYTQLNTDLQLALENMRQCQSRFENGFGTSLEVIDAQLVVEKNRIDQLKSLFEYYKSLTDLYTAAGHPETVVDLLSTKG
jgi:outer membrane protein TolC